MSELQVWQSMSIYNSTISELQHFVMQLLILRVVNLLCSYSKQNIIQNTGFTQIWSHLTSTTTTDLVWKVARYTSASPIFFGEFENYVDGGVLANNPCDCGMTAIQNFYRLQGEKLRIALVVSVGKCRLIFTYNRVCIQLFMVYQITLQNQWPFFMCISFIVSLWLIFFSFRTPKTFAYTHLSLICNIRTSANHQLQCL